MFFVQVEESQDITTVKDEFKDEVTAEEHEVCPGR
jgi:hypothetical protein